MKEIEWLKSKKIVINTENEREYNELTNQLKEIYKTDKKIDEFEEYKNATCFKLGKSSVEVGNIRNFRAKNEIIKYKDLLEKVKKQTKTLKEGNVC